MPQTNDQKKLQGAAGKAPCLLIHGLTAAPEQWDPPRMCLEAAGFSVQVPCLAGHGTAPAALDTVRWQDWYADILRVYGAATTPMNIAGLSLGGLLGLHLAIERPELVRRLVVVGVPLVLPTWVEILYRLIRYTPLRWIIKAWPKDYAQSVADPAGRAQYQALGYSVFPLAAAVQLKHLQMHVVANLPRLTVPVTVVHARKDTTALPAGVALLQERTGAPVTVHWFEASYHVVTLDYDRDRLGELLVQEFA